MNEGHLLARQGRALRGIAAGLLTERAGGLPGAGVAWLGGPSWRRPSSVSAARPRLPALTPPGVAGFQVWRAW